ncbi:hypothetical protein RhiirA4_411172 [Rhizophagus irregularis]|uniref:Uncharacterized protein n=1 Tax=Rhizophagus irregularis TaxID=588596 RepID=A0A2I1HC33_9GLOM|nr:hypothetical protein RhiirA4_411172 [Rhizophagus irregularis]
MNSTVENNNISEMRTEKVLEILKGFFHAGDAHKSERYSAKEMLEALRKKVEIGELCLNNLSVLNHFFSFFFHF